MANKVTDISKSSARSYETISKTPKNRNHDNFFLKELQDKYNAEWQYAPNVVTVEYEKTWGKEDYDTIEVRDQKPRSDKNKAFSDDLKRLVFKDIFEKRFRIGSKFRFNEVFDDDTVPNEAKDVWLVTNMVYANPNTSVIVSRCSGKLGFRLKDEQGVSHTYYEPAIMQTDIKRVAFHYNQTIIAPESELIVLVQHNERTAHFYVNQRFVIGYDQVYRIKGLDKFYSDQTYNPYSAGLITLYMELTEQSPKDVFGEDGLAYGEHHDVVMDQEGQPAVHTHRIVWDLPAEIPPELPNNPLVFKAVLKDGDTPLRGNVSYSYELLNLPEGVDAEKYVDFKVLDDGSFSISRKKRYLNGNIRITASVGNVGEPDYQSVSFELLMNGM